MRDGTLVDVMIKIGPKKRTSISFILISSSFLSWIYGIILLINVSWFHYLRPSYIKKEFIHLIWVGLGDLSISKKDSLKELWPLYSDEMVNNYEKKKNTVEWDLIKLLLTNQFSFVKTNARVLKLSLIVWTGLLSNQYMYYDGSFVLCCTGSRYLSYLHRH